MNFMISCMHTLADSNRLSCKVKRIYKRSKWKNESRGNTSTLDTWLEGGTSIKRPSTIRSQNKPHPPKLMYNPRPILNHNDQTLFDQELLRPGHSFEPELRQNKTYAQTTSMRSMHTLFLPRRTTFEAWSRWIEQGTKTRIKPKTWPPTTLRTWWPHHNQNRAKLSNLMSPSNQKYTRP